MSDLMKKSLTVVREGLDSLKTMRADKRAYKQYVKRIQALPDDYRLVFEKSTQYMWSYSGGGNGYDMLSLHADLLDLFETSAADGKRVFDVTGEDVAAFCDELLRNAKTYTEDRREKLNRDILKKLKPEQPE